MSEESIYNIHLLEMIEVQIGDVSTAQRQARLGKPPRPAARRVIHPVGEAAEGDAGPGCTDHQVCHLQLTG